MLLRPRPRAGSDPASLPVSATWAKVAGALLLVLAACITPAATEPPRPPALGSPASPTVAVPASTPLAETTAVAPSADRPSACVAPSLSHDGPRDARDTIALARCERLRTGEEMAAMRCGQGASGAAIDHARLEVSVLAFDTSTREQVVSLGRRGAALGRRPRVFGLVGDSMTASPAFLGHYSAEHPPVELDASVRAALRTPVPGVADATILDFYRGERAEPSARGRSIDAFGATRAARDGARSWWPLVNDRRGAPLLRMLRSLEPSVAVVAFGGNDAGHYAPTPSEVADEVETHLGKLLDRLDREGIVPILTTLPRHGDAPSMADCGHAGVANDWRMAVNTNAISARIAAIACRRHLPLVDLRHALESAVNHGLGPDGIHPSHFAEGSGHLTAAGLRCGYNVRNYLTLRMLRQVKETLEHAGVW